MAQVESSMSPFVIPREDVEALEQSEGFRVLRSYLASSAHFCADHDTCDKGVKESWVLHRDILHALTAPVVELYVRASALAQAALCTHKPEDLELAFGGEARGAFLWLQCFVSEEEDWCRTKGCPACVTTAALSTESHIRLTIAASLLSTASISSPNSSPAASTNSSPVTTPTSEDPSSDADTDVSTQASALQLPPLPHILPALRSALENDPFWGPEYWSFFFARATGLSAGMQALIAECIGLESLVSSPAAATSTPTSRLSAKRNATMPGLLHIAANAVEEERGAKLRKSKMAKRQLRMKTEEMELMRRSALQCWAKAAVPSKLRKDILSVASGEKRVRSLTCP
ncbi:hypothetical protein BDV96DRAFT_610567 [Lophiotrema nucula]|uniref:Uncharacterized protein n=1 Tax=Lophiotrema nucula TaxID=690887 RepID=A0A6A5ZLC8_9PLEO|nr:hypothetical protein BDV96DRAFT_610567 [Lophiotrema nucula]